MNNSGNAAIQRFFLNACLFEASLLLVAYGLGWIADINPLQHLEFSESALLIGFAGTLPLILLFMALHATTLHSVRVIRNLLMETLASRLHALHWTDLFVLSAIAGVAEEVLFRGVIQPWLETAWSESAALWLSSVLFGLVHAVTPLYAVLATLVSVYLGLSLDYAPVRNLLIPIVIHALYDFFAFIMLVRSYKALHVQ